MRKIFSLALLLITLLPVESQVQLPVYPDSLFSTYYHQRRTLFQSLPQTKGDILFIGNSITDGGEWSELFNDLRMKNRGISGDISAGIIKRIDEVAERKPAKVFLLIGVNDLARGISPDSVVKNILLIADYLNGKTPSTKLFVQSILPVNNVYGKFGDHTSKTKQIKQVNEKLFNGALVHQYTFIDLYTFFCNEEGKLDPELSNDGLHLTGIGYLRWKHIIYPYVYDFEKKPSLIPMPQQASWKKGCFPLYNCKTILITDNKLEKEAAKLKLILKNSGWMVVVKEKVETNGNYIELRLGNIETPSQNEESYRLEVSEDKILLTASNTHGIFNGIQTLSQLMRSGVMVDACEITDWPAFSWRGYMIDAGRNYMSMDLLKQQIDIMAKYKLNVFHFHATEDIAWRIAIKQYPQLTAPENMLRNKGQYYSEADIKELITYCKERYIRFVPEIDMPGHSAAFKRAMKTDMQSDTGLQYVKNILREFCETYDVSYIHIGADEVKITNKNFIPGITAFIQSLGKKVIGWQPGGNFTNNTIRQLWMDDNGHLDAGKDIQYIDSRHLYLNHMDPLEAVTTIFYRQIGGRIKEDSNMKGATLCLWPDRRVEKEEDAIKMNAVYPGLLAFAERSWKGDGYKGWLANIGDPNSLESKQFTQFENRLLDHKQQFFSGLSFPYVKQSGIIWNLFGPYPNAGNLSKKFGPENKDFDEVKIKPAIQVIGGTIILRHWWYPLIKGAIQEPDDSITWYATTKIWSDEDKIQPVWIGFNNLSRSPATDSPPAGAWDDKQSTVWVNGNIIVSPVWKRGGQKGNSETPLIDEGYEYREPANVLLKKGWNTILIKCPVGTFKGKDWQNPVKWMFTFVPFQ